MTFDRRWRSYESHAATSRTVSVDGWRPCACFALRPPWRAAATRGSVVQVVAKSGLAPRVFVSKRVVRQPEPNVFRDNFELIEPRCYRISRLGPAPPGCCCSRRIASSGLLCVWGFQARKFRNKKPVARFSGAGPVVRGTPLACKWILARQSLLQGRYRMPELSLPVEMNRTRKTVLTLGAELSHYEEVSRKLLIINNLVNVYIYLFMALENSGK